MYPINSRAWVVLLENIVKLSYLKRINLYDYLKSLMVSKMLIAKVYFQENEQL